MPSRLTAVVLDADDPDRLHLHLTSADAVEQRTIVGRVIRLGGDHLDVGQRPEERHVVLVDPKGKALCVIAPGNAFLTGCGPLGEAACDGSRRVGCFWGEVLGWPLVWDQDEETAIQSLHGGTKVAWGGPLVLPQRGRNRQRFELAVVKGDLEREVDRLAGLGARVVGRDAGGEVVELVDPDGNEFQLCRGEPAVGCA
ncbi:VOC family protein [Arsenicicoccus cauae]|uniref:VOC family protein n=1 Tax=Arsenicicoccus cauae TaxID=2663847 RepID=UPI00370D889A